MLVKVVAHDYNNCKVMSVFKNGLSSMAFIISWKKGKKMHILYVLVFVLRARAISVMLLLKHL